MSFREHVVSFPAAGRLVSPDDIYVSPDVRVTFVHVADLGVRASPAYSDDNAVVMRFIRASDACIPDIQGIPGIPGAGIRVEIAAAESPERWTQLRPWSDDVASDYMLMLGCAYRVLATDASTLFELRPPAPRRELFCVRARHITTFTPRLQRMYLGDE